MTLPFWYTQALAAPSESGHIEFEGARVVFETWGEVGKPGVVLIHGSNAHLEWWRFTAPFLADQFRLVAIDLSGHGNSGWRERYNTDQFGREVWAVCQAAQLGENPIVVGHSFGGVIALETAHLYSDQMRGLILMDYTTAAPEDHIEWGLRAEREGVDATRKLRVYDSLETAMGRFRLIPEQPGVLPELLTHMARYGLKEVEGGWTWKFDPTMYDYLGIGTDQQHKYVDLKCRSALMLGEKSEDEGAFFAHQMVEITGGYLPVVTVPGTYHHLMFDQPMAVAMALKTQMLEWIRQDNADQMAAHLARRKQELNNG